jgi:putative ATP-binding cassette transporter
LAGGGDEPPLIRDLSAVFAEPLRVGIGGSHERAKEALFKATADLGIAGWGRILRPTGRAMQFLTERPYLPPGSLRQVLDGETGELTDSTLIGSVKAFGLDALLDQSGGLDEERDWSATLTLAQQQLLALSAVTLARPRMLFLNRATSALTREQTVLVLRVLAESGIGYVLIGKVDKYPEHFVQILELDEQGGWQLRTLSGETPPIA